MRPKNDDNLLDRSQDTFRYLQSHYTEVTSKSLEKSRQAALETKRGVNLLYLNLVLPENKKT